ncbi:hypothetical protein GF314_16510 [bacterium]|nr:hypothetical protein [bacterium]
MKDWHEPWDRLSDETRDLQRALVSLQEEIEAVNWYLQRAELATDDGLRRILLHNRDEEIEHACMTLEWLRRRMPEWDEELRTYLFREGEITELEEADDDAGPATGLGIGKPKGDG